MSSRSALRIYDGCIAGGDARRGSAERMFKTESTGYWSVGEPIKHCESSCSVASEPGSRGRGADPTIRLRIGEHEKLERGRLCRLNQGRLRAAMSRFGVLVSLQKSRQGFIQRKMHYCGSPCGRI